MPDTESSCRRIEVTLDGKAYVVVLESGQPSQIDASFMGYRRMTTRSIKRDGVLWRRVLKKLEQDLAEARRLAGLRKPLTSPRGKLKVVK